ncbi:Ig-like domain-containing protein, partial [Staphylococcus aureus]|uniref:Ig-like domain-containing protein n=1 Tax=Staphylococcus aureus TaxID=1280 RepID=UPI003BF701D6
MPNAVNTYGDTRYYSDFREELKNSNGDVIALGEYDVASHTLTYKFTSTVNNLTKRDRFIQFNTIYGPSSCKNIRYLS